MFKKTNFILLFLLLSGLILLFYYSCQVPSEFCSECGYYDYYDSSYYPGVEEFGELEVNPFVLTADDKLATFGVDVDTGSYTFGRSKIYSGVLPQPESVRVEEYINYFNQEYPEPENHPFSVYTDAAPSLFRKNLHVLRIGLKGKTFSEETRKPWNLTFLVDISGSMTIRLPLVKRTLYILTEQMKEGDKISICTYAGDVKTVLTPHKVDNIEQIKTAISNLKSGGGTAMASGIVNAYKVNSLGFIKDGVNRIIVCSDGDANIGTRSHEEILAMIREYVKKGITLTTLGFGTGNYNDYLMEQLANNGNGNYYYIPNETEAKRLLCGKLMSVMEIIAKDVKVQVEFNTSKVFRYRLLGYENRAIDDDDFTNEEQDAGEIGSGHVVTALFELELHKDIVSDLGIIHLRYKLPDGTEDIALDVLIKQSYVFMGAYSAPARYRFTCLVAEFAEILRESPYVNTQLKDIIPHIKEAVNPNDKLDLEFKDLVMQTSNLQD